MRSEFSNVRRSTPITLGIVNSNGEFVLWIYRVFYARARASVFLKIEIRGIPLARKNETILRVSRLGIFFFF